jgi:5-methyltetrahydrofolate--homocysteine methyltransferase
MRYLSSAPEAIKKERYQTLIPVIVETDYKVIALCMSDEEVPQSVEYGLKIAERLVNGIIQDQVKLENIFTDHRPKRS